jgi:signal transduction histidine kinase
MVDIVVDLQDDRMIIRISDDGQGAEKLQPGNGLRGIRERVDGLHGELVWQTLPKKGFDIGIVIPWRRESA